jgi:hypothetical protein
MNRREFLGFMLGGSIGAAACACGGFGAGLWLLLREESTSTQVLLATSAVNRQDALITIDRPAIVPRADWGAVEPNHLAENENGFYSEENPTGWREYEGDLRDIYNTVVIHHAAIDTADDLSNLLEIQSLHRKDRGWADVAYHYFIGKSGTVYEGRTINARGVHVAGHNTGTLGVCFLGNYMNDIPTPESLTAATSLTMWLAVRLQLTHLAGHREFNSGTVCPGDNIFPLLPDFAEAAGLLLGTAGYVEPTTNAEMPTAARCFCHL